MLQIYCQEGEQRWRSQATARSCFNLILFAFLKVGFIYLFIYSLLLFHFDFFGGVVGLQFACLSVKVTISQRVVYKFTLHVKDPQTQLLGVLLVLVASAGASGMNLVPYQTYESICCANHLIKQLKKRKQLKVSLHKLQREWLQTSKMNFYMVKHAWFDNKLSSSLNVTFPTRVSILKFQMANGIPQE